MDEIERRLRRLRRIRTELEDLGLDGAAEEVEDEISLLLDTRRQGGAVSGFVAAALELERGLNEADRQGGRR